MLLFTGHLVRVLNEVDASRREQYAAILISRVLGYVSNLPTSPVEEPSAYFNDLHLGNVVKVIQDVNEQCLIPVEVTLQYTREVWLARYRMVYNPFSDEVMCATTKILNCDSAVYSPAVLEIIGTVDAKRCLHSVTNDAVRYYNAVMDGSNSVK